MLDDALRNDAGQVAVKWVLNRPAKPIHVGGTDRHYVPTYAHNVPMYWVNEEDVLAVLAIQEKHCNCANGIRKHAYILANQIDVSLHKCGQRHCDE